MYDDFNYISKLNLLLLCRDSLIYLKNYNFRNLNIIIDLKFALV